MPPKENKLGVFRYRREIDNFAVAFERMEKMRGVTNPREQRDNRKKIRMLAREFTPSFARTFIAKYPNKTDVRQDGIGKNNQGADHILEQLKEPDYAALKELLTIKGRVYRSFVKTLVSRYLNGEVNKQRRALAVPLCNTCKNCSCRRS